MIHSHLAVEIYDFCLPGFVLYLFSSGCPPLVQAGILLSRLLFA